jgi:hypothetical protein
MAELVLTSVPDDLVRQIEDFATADAVPLEQETVLLLQAAVSSKRRECDRSQVVKILHRISRNRFAPDPGGPSVVGMLQEDRQR